MDRINKIHKILLFDVFDLIPFILKTQFQWRLIFRLCRS